MLDKPRKQEIELMMNVEERNLLDQIVKTHKVDSKGAKIGRFDKNEIRINDP